MLGAEKTVAMSDWCLVYPAKIHMSIVTSTLQEMSYCSNPFRKKVIFKCMVKNQFYTKCKSDKIKK
jgi:hypothetical protein